MTDESLRAIGRLHGALALALTAGLAWAAWRATRTGRATTWLALACAGLGTAVGALGFLLEPRYRTHVRAALFARSVQLGWLFERKQHLAFGAIVLAWCAAFALSAASSAEEPSRAHLHRAAGRALVAGAVLSVASTIASAIVGT